MPPSPFSPLAKSFVRDSNLGTAIDGGRGQDFVVLLNIDGVSTGEPSGAGVGGGRAAGESDGAKVGERDQAAAFLKVLDDPLGVLAGQGLAADGLAHRLSGAGVLDGGGA